MFIRIAQLATYAAWFWWELAWGGMQISNGSDREMNIKNSDIYLHAYMKLFAWKECARQAGLNWSAGRSLAASALLQNCSL